MTTFILRSAVCLFCLCLAAMPASSQIFAWTLSSDDGDLERIDLGSGESDQLGAPIGRRLSGLAFDPDGRLWSVDPWVPELVELDPVRGGVIATAPLDPSFQVVSPDLTFDPCGRLYILDRPDVVDPAVSLYQIAPDGSATLLGSPDRELRSIAATEGRLIGLAVDDDGVASLVDVDRLTGTTYGERAFQDGAGGDAWIGFEENGTLWGVDPGSDFGPPFPARAWTAAPLLARRSFTSNLATVIEISGLALAPPRGSCNERCDEGKFVHCFNEGRFSVEVTFDAGGGDTGTASTVLAKSIDSGLFTFFDPSNWEVMAKVLDACAVNGHYWVFLAAATDLSHQVRVTDTQTLESRFYDQPPGPSEAVNDTTAFPCANPPEVSVASDGPRTTTSD